MLLFRIVSQNLVGTNEIHPKRHSQAVLDGVSNILAIFTIKSPHKTATFRLFAQRLETPISQNASGAVENMAGFEKFSL